MTPPLPFSDLKSTGVVLPSLADRFAAIVDSICRVVAVRMAGAYRAGDGVTASLLMLLYGRLRRAILRFARIAAAPARGAVGARAAVESEAAAGRDDVAEDIRVRMPRGIGWLLRIMVVDEACRAQLCGFAQQLAHLLEDTEMVALMAATPRVGRILRPLCRALPIAVPEAVALAPRVAAIRLRVAHERRRVTRADLDWADGGVARAGGLRRGEGLVTGLGSFKWRGFSRG